MNASTRKRKAADIMTTNVVYVDAEATLAQVLEVLIENHVSGVPVIDSKRRCIGSVSASDVLGYEHEHFEDSDDDEDVSYVFDIDKQQWESIRPGAFSAERIAHVGVREVMSVDPVVAPLDSSIKDVAQLMVEQSVHRVFVVDENSVLQGIISTLDLAKVVAED